ncbi:MAG: carbohydrate binding family 9 domain-containing protein [Acidobacteria bacterium]|nr:carbohydrate binding family 9 domain-containing protein [Acidobacteriota bacterium]
MAPRLVGRINAALTLVLLATASHLGAQTVFPPPAEPPQLAATRTTGPIQVDGVLDEGAWSGAVAVDRFVQAEPQQGQPATEPTVVRVLFDERFLYFGVTCTDSRGAEDLRVRDLRRDFDETTDDFFGVAIDGVRDGRSALVFRVNPRGALRDQQTVDGGLVDLDFDAVWTARTTRSQNGWTLEMAIPWETLRYREGLTSWGINFQRVTRRLNENSGWSPWPRVVAPYRMDYAGVLTGIEPPPPSRNLRLLPYLVGDRRATGGRPAAATGDIGADIKWAVSPSAVLDVTVNPDFGQTDVDRQVVNLTRFSVFFPERRQFFLENRALFFSGNGQRFEPFFSRRIGLDTDGNPIPITAGGRFSVRGRSGAFGALAVSQRGDTDASESQFGVLRYVANFGAQNRLGGLVTTRRDGDGTTNVVGGIDGFWRPTPTAFVRGTVTGSTTGGRGGEGVGAFVWIANETTWGYLGYVSELVTAGFDARAGFIVRNDYVRISPAVILDWRPRWRPRWIRRFQPGFVLEHYVSPTTGAVQEGVLSLRPMTVEFQNGGFLRYELQPSWQRPLTQFRPLPGVSVEPGKYDYLRHSLVLQTDPSAPMALRLEAATGGYFDGDLHTVRAVVQATPDPRFAVSADYTINRLARVGLADVSPTTHLLGAETRLAANPRLQLVTFAQWNTATRQFTGNARLSWEYRPLAFFTVVYNHRAPVSGLGTAAAPVESRQLLLKGTWLFQL